jgi:Flp pilus assembly pilin Flp
MTGIGFDPYAKTESKMMNRQFSWRNVALKFVECLRDERGIAMTEYLIIVTFVVLPAVFYLFNPDNGFYQAVRNQYNLTTLLLVFPGP